MVSFPVESLFENLSQPTKSVSFRMKRFLQILWSCNNGWFQDWLEPTKAVEFDLESRYTIFGSAMGCCVYLIGTMVVFDCGTLLLDSNPKNVPAFIVSIHTF